MSVYDGRPSLESIFKGANSIQNMHTNKRLTYKTPSILDVLMNKLPEKFNFGLIKSYMVLLIKARKKCNPEIVKTERPLAQGR